MREIERDGYQENNAREKVVGSKVVCVRERERESKISSSQSVKVCVKHKRINSIAAIHCLTERDRKSPKNCVIGKPRENMI